MGARYYTILLTILFASCNAIEPTQQTEPAEPIEHGYTIIYRDDSTEWLVWVPYSRVYVYDSYVVDSPYHVPTHEEAKILKTITYGPSGQRYLTDDGYTFGMPSASITKAGTKTKYSVLALWRRRYIITQDF